MELREEIRQAGLQIGFDQIGFAPAERPLHADAYLEWIARGWHGEMDWIAREDAIRRRLSPSEALSGCRSVIVVTLSHAREPLSEADPCGEGAGWPPDDGGSIPIVARYALGRDYHEVFEEKLSLLAQAVHRLSPGAAVRPYVDYGPVLERDHAQRAGLGWIGKNTLLIHPRLGSWLLLGELLTDLELPPDAAFTDDHCGTCARCIAACPTNAIRAPRELDARLCISYLTIELRGSIPERLRPLIGNRVFGCDICQEVCPWNREVTPVGSDFLEPGRAVPFATMREWVETLVGLDEEGFRRRYSGTALRRTGRSGLLRNLCVGLGNSGDRTAAPVLRKCLEDPSGLVREHAAWALERLAG